jgi:transcriptional regulator with XRE-family HTH domain
MEQAIQDVLAELGLPQFEMGSDGYPIPGRVVKHYREMMKYTDRRGRERHWTQKDLAEKLGISEIMVNLMEKHNQGLDSIERRRVLATILKIPPVLLGLDSLDHIVELATGQHAPIQTASTNHPDYQNTYNVYKKMYHDGLSYMILRDIEAQAKQLEDGIKNNHLDDKELSLHLLWQYEVLCAKIFSADVSDWAKTFEHIDNAKDIATYLDDRDLQAASLCYSAIFHFRQGRIGAAKMDIDGAATYAKGSLPQTRGIICSKSACIYAESDTSTSGIVLAQSMLDKAEKLTESREDRATISFGKDDFYLDKAYVLNRLNRHAKSLEMLEDAERYVQAAGKRHSVFLEIKKAQCYIEQKKPEYEQAIWMLLNAVETSKEIKVARNMEQVNKLYEKLAASSYAKSPDVADLGMQIQKLRHSAF